MVLNGYYGLFASNLRENKLGIKRLNAEHINNFNAQTLRSKLLSSIKCVMHELTCSDKKNVTTLADNVALAHLEG